MSIEINGRYVEVSGHRLYMDTAGEGGRPMLLIHTAGQQSLQWRFVMPYFAQRGYFTVAPDLPGHGKSLLKDFKPVTSTHEFAEVMWKVVQDLELDRPVVIGVSIGGDIALDLAANHGSRLRAVIACEAAARNPTFPVRMIESGLEDSGIPSYSDQGYFGGRSACGTKALSERVLEIAWTRRMGDPKIYYSDLIAWKDHDIRAKLHQISCPLLMVWGNEDYFVPYSFVEEDSQGIRKAKLKVLEGIGHYPHIETPEFNLLVKNHKLPRIRKRPK